MEKINNKQNKKLNSRLGHEDVVDVIRGIGIIMILLVHYGQSFDNPFFTRFGQMGCQMFFVMSGYTCSMSFAKKSTKEFYQRRFVSIAPEYYTTLFVVVIANMIIKKHFGFNFVGPGNTGFLSVLCNFLLLNGIIPFCNNNVFPGGWFIGALVIMYCMHPLFDKIFRKSSFKAITTLSLSFGMIVCDILLNYISTNSWTLGNSTFYYYCFLNQCCCYLIGMYLYQILKSDNSRKQIVGYPSALFFSLVFLVVCLIVFYSDRWFRFACVPFLMGVFTFFLFIFLKDKTFFYRARSILVFLGENSFYIYLTHTCAVWTFVKIMKRIVFSNAEHYDKVLFYLLLLPSFIIVLLLSYLLKRVGKKERIILDRYYKKALIDK